jgi:hypothetical protein
MLKSDTTALMAKAKELEGKINTARSLKSMMVNSAESKAFRNFFTSKMRDILKNDESYELLLPDFAPGCRRLTPGNPYMKAI